MSDNLAHEQDEVLASTPKAEIAEAETLADKERLVGIMYSEKAWVVSPWMKVAFFWCSLVLLGGLIAYGVDKRATMARLTMDSVVEPTPLKATIAPDFTLPIGETNQGLQLSSLKGQWVFVNFWATWCPPCRDEMPSMEMLNRRFGTKMKMLAISVDEDWKEVNRFFGEDKPSFTVLWDKSKQVSTRMYGTRKFPESFLISPEGEVVVKFVGPRDWYNLGTVQYFEEILEGKRNPRS